MFDRSDSRSSRRDRIRRGIHVILVASAAWFTACAEDPGPIEPTNRAPTVSQTIPNRSVRAGAVDTINVQDHFVDPDGDELTYSAESSDSAVVTVEVHGGVLTLAGVAQGTATITVTATDSGGLTATLSFLMSVRGGDWVVLVDLYRTMDGTGWYEQGNWLSEEPLDRWYGVGVDSAGRVDSLDLRGNSVVGEIPSALGELSALKVLDLSFNWLLGSIPPELGDLEELEYLDLALGRLSGSIPPTIFGLTGLTHLDLASNRLEGTISDQVGRLGNLTLLNLSDNRLTGTLPPELGDLSVLDGLGLWDNELTGPIPEELGNLTELRLISLRDNALTGAIPETLGNLTGLTLLALSDNALTGSIPSTLGNLTQLVNLRMSRNDLTGPIPPTLGNLTALTALEMSENRLTGPIPPTLGNLTALELLLLESNELAGPIPPELGNLTRLERFLLHDNRLTGPIPAELGGLIRLPGLDLSGNALTGSIPPEIGRLNLLRYLDFAGNELTGPIPGELGSLINLRWLDLSDNDLSGPIPGELGDLWYLETMQLSGNSLTDPLPAGLGNLRNLRALHLRDNDLTGPVTPEVGTLFRLRHLDVRQNPRLSGEIPNAWTALVGLDTLAAHDTDLCVPPYPVYQDWLEGVLHQRVATCGEWAAYLTQAVQSREYPVPLVAGNDALLRVFPTAVRATVAGLPPVRATFYLDGAEAHRVEIAGSATPVPTAIDEGSLEKSANADIPGSVVRPGLEMVVEIDPDGTLDPELGVARRIPETGRLPVRVVDIPNLDFTLIPFLYDEDPDSAIVGLVEEMAASPDGHELLSLMRTVLPVSSVTAAAHEPVWTSTNVAIDLFAETVLIRVAEQGSRWAGLSRYMGMMSGPVVGGGEEDFGSARVAFAIPNDTAFARAVGVISSLRPARCGEAHTDPYYPYEDGSIGAWGYDSRIGALISPATPDLMSRCGHPGWISDYHFAKAVRYRRSPYGARTAATATSTSTTPSLLLWGGVRADGEPFLEPAFVVDVPSAPAPPAGSENVITGRSAAGEELFSLRFDMTEAPGGGGSFAMAVPASPDWARRLAVITLSGPGGGATLNLDGDRPVVILRDPVNGRIRGILRGSAAAALADADPGAVSFPLRGLEVMTSRGVPGPELWRR